MRQAATIMMLGLCAVSVTSTRGEGPPPSSEPAAVARAKGLILAGDRRAALTALEDALIDGPAADRPAVLELLRRCYAAMARDAESAGDAEAAAGYRDNLAILERAHPSPRPAAPPRAEPAPARNHPAPALARPPAPARNKPGIGPAPESILAPGPGEGPPSTSPMPELRAPMPAVDPSEPLKLPAPASLPAPARIPAPAALARLPRSDAAVAPVSAPGPDPNGGREEMVNPGEVIGAAAPAPARLDAPAPAPARPSRPATGPGSTMAPAPAVDSSDLAAGDQLFRAQNFDGAGRIYAALASRHLLPPDRRPHWAYCRTTAVVRRINAGPRSAAEWDAIEAEIHAIKQIAPGNWWYGDYLMSKVAEARGSRRRRPKSSGNVVVRGSSPDDAAPSAQPAPSRRRPLRSRGTPANAPPSPAPPPDGDRTLNLPGSLALPEPEGAAAASPAAAPDPVAAGPSSAIDWQIHESANFRIHHRDPALAEQAAAVAESVRTAQARRWGTAATRAAWTPRCDLYLYPTASDFAGATGQPETAPGLSTISNDGMRVVSRRMSLRADNRLLLTATLPHEVTHIVLADLFVAQPIPRWADEGLAVLAEPEAELRHRQADLKGPLSDGRVFEAGQLMAMDYPNPKDWHLFYAQSVSLTRFLVEQGPPERFIQFVRDTQRMGTEAALRDVYQIDGVAALHDRWLDYARKQAAVDLASTQANAATPGDPRRD